MRITTRLGLGIALALISQNASASVRYTYQSSTSNPLFITGQNSISNLPTNITMSFLTRQSLESNSVYNIAVNPVPGPDNLNWASYDSTFNISISGTNGSIEKVPSPGLIEGGGLYGCNNYQRCFGGAIATDQNGNIIKWNIIAANQDNLPYLLFLSYNTPSLGSIDGVGFTDNGRQQVALNTLNGGIGSWIKSVSSDEVLPPGPMGGVPEPASWALMLIGFGIMGAAMRTSQLRFPHSVETHHARKLGLYRAQSGQEAQKRKRGPWPPSLRQTHCMGLKTHFRAYPDPLAPVKQQ